MSYRVCIPAAGTGSRLGDLTRYLNKSLVGIANRPVLSHLIEQFPAETGFVIALGYKGALIREFLELAYPERQFYFAEVEPFEGPGSGLGLSLLACSRWLQQPFIFISCDTLVKETIPAPDHNWMAFAERAELDAYRTLALDNGYVSAICEKGEGREGSHKPYIGLAGIHDFQAFWRAMEQGGAVAIQTGEAHGMRELLTRRIRAYEFTWHDTGSREALALARESYRESGSPNILEKANEAIWFVEKRVIKFSDDQDFIANRVKRADELKGFIPEVTGVQPHMYCYSLVEGRVLSEVATLPLFDQLLRHCSSFWTRKALQADSALVFKRTCMRFYRDKTFERVELFYRNCSKQDRREPINGIPMPELGTLLHSIDWEWLADGLPGRFHGDFHFENILWDAAARKFTFLDWRQDFGGNLVTGDIYYDFAKLLHGLIISHELIAGDFYSVEWREDAIDYDFHRKQIHVECERRFGEWLEAEGYDYKKVRVLTSLIYLNIAALHHYPYNLFLFALGKAMLKTEMEK
ncbi:phosphotransferase [Chlorobium ferrooxidans]|uniref:Nucleoside-diphosphate-sugar pyrophosphorylase involved in lipopolysaccharide biosynthesis/translation initiation factor 2B gamma/epsilon subunits (EIF-2Bgamma/eIF-2Bepsilon)-like n=1 Tax=Chlorobium ferrooxidans DSM 13031 TaxID=377431 RepID=Q0YTX3_9CHLB|nr:phosphotransferase [Chlorobium ferrooxidans]EAT59779.1 Nucleoside-diphosphate-sugar pyrophosphorylase involved in lipopolysaccharide biosynthesis/translation initiation factor 2B gamma/epsilon subunits (eIF-2Bgamma/eIF-2Bepsilon)-like [Chlorobium ferrooxidans DSM 13031]